MWFYPLLLTLLVLGLAGFIFLGGVYTLVLVPLVVIALGSAVVYGLWARAHAAPGERELVSKDAGRRPLPHQRRRASGHEPTNPERLAEGRLRQQQVRDS